MLKNYIVPYGFRFCDVGKNRNTTTLMVVDDIGIAVRHDRDNIPTNKDVRSHLIGYTDREMRIQAESIEDCLKQFYELDEAKLGKRAQAYTLEASESNPIIEYVGCKDMGEDLNCKAFDDEYTEPDSFLLCILNGCDDVHDGCPIKQQMDNPSEVVQFGDVWVRQYDDKPQISLW